MIGMKVRLANGKFGKVIKVLSSQSVIVHYKEKDEESYRVSTYDEIMAGPIEMCLFDKSITGSNANYAPVKRGTDGRPKE